MAEIEWRWKPEEIAAVRAIAEEQAGSNYVAWRRRQTLDNPPPLNGRAQFWYALVMCLLTSQQKSGPRSAVTRFLSLKPFPLSLEWCEAGMTETAAADIVKGSGGLRFHARIARFLTTNLRALSGPGWASIERWTSRLSEQRDRAPRDGDQQLEREAAHAIDSMLVGIGPKQARNLWQYLGLSRFEIPVDSRVSTWLRENGFPMPLLPDLLFNEKYYCLALDGVQSICRAAEVLPCIFDAAVFASYDSQWKPDLVY